METLEPRVLFSADALPAVAGLVPEAPPPIVATVRDGGPAEIADALAPSDATSVAASELVVIDAATPDIDALLADLQAHGDAGPEVVMLDADGVEAALEQLGKLLAERHDLDALHLISHGADGELLLGGERLTTIDLLARAAQIGSWRDAFADGADLLLYGCDVAASAQGRNFVDTLAALTGTDVAASTDVTGAARLGGDWRLEYARGDVTHDALASAALRGNYDATLATYTVTNFGDSGGGTLRQAITLANANAGVDTILFNGPGTISLASALPEISNQIVIDATIGTGFVGVPRVVLDGVAAGASTDGLSLGAGSDGSTVRGLMIVNFSNDGIQIADSNDHIIESNYVGTDGTTALGNLYGIAVDDADGVRIGGPNGTGANLVSGNVSTGFLLAGSTNATIQSNLIGTDASGTSVIGNGSVGVILDGGSSSNEIGGRGATSGNVIAGNGDYGVFLVNAGASNRVSGNLIGLAVDGSTALGGQTVGVAIEDTGSTVVGEDTILEPDSSPRYTSNVISGNDDAGVSIRGSSSTGNRIIGNYIGTDAGGSVAVPNGGDGIALFGGANGNAIGEVGLGNVIAGNASTGVQITGSGTNANTLLGNHIGIDASGIAAIPNGESGIQIGSGASANLVGSGAVGAGNVISGNTFDGVSIIGAGTDSNLVHGNTIGMNTVGDTAVANGYSGVSTIDGAANNDIGGVGLREGNLVSGNTYSGVYLGGNGTSGNRVLANVIGLNAAGDAAVGNTHSGVYVDTSASGNLIGIAGAGNISSGNGDFGVFLGGAGTDGNTVSANWIGLDGTGLGVVANGRDGVRVEAGAAGSVIGGDVSLGEGNAISGNAGDGIEVRDAGTDATTVTGNFLGTDSSGIDSIGSRGFANGSAGIHVTDGATSTMIGGTSAPLRNIVSGNGTHGVFIADAGIGTTVQGNYVGLDANGDSLGNQFQGVITNGTTSGAQIGGVGDLGNVISSNGSYGVMLSQGGAGGQVVSGNYIGTDPTGTSARGNGLGGVFLSFATNGNTIGGDGLVGEGNLISGNGGAGILVRGAGVDDNVVIGNRIGTNALGTAALGNTTSGILVIGGAERTRIGSGVSGHANLLSGNTEHGLRISGAGTNGSVVAGNLIGLDASGLGVLGNGGDGIQVQGGALDTVIGGDALSGEGNVISGNTADGIDIQDVGTDRTIVTGNRIGTDKDGVDSIGGRGFANGDDGIQIGESADGTVIGGGTGGTGGLGNVISGNGDVGITVTSSATNTAILGNLIGVDASGSTVLGNNDDGIRIAGAAQGTVVGGDASLGEGNIISGNGGDGIDIRDAGTDGTTVTGNHIGTNASGVDSIGSRGFANNASGVSISSGAGGTVIGGAGTTLRNVIAGNNEHGVLVDDAAAGTTVLGNRLGLDANGDALGNRYTGVIVAGTSSGVQIGGAGGAGNVISANLIHGVMLAEAGPVGHVVSGNRIGTDATGTVALGNGLDGVHIGFGASGHTIGGDVGAGEGNLISGNGQSGIELSGAGTDNNVVVGNLIGTTATGISPLANGTAGTSTGQSSGVRIDNGASGNRIGGAFAADRNVIAASDEDGVYIDRGSSDNIVAGNYIGVGADGVTGLGNGGHGVSVSFGSMRTIIGQDGASYAGNVISDNADHGILLEDADVVDTVIAGNRIGTTADGEIGLGNGGNGVELIEAVGTRIGGTSAGDGNVVSGNGGHGIEMGNAGGTTVQGNTIGLGSDGEALGNGSTGVRIDGASTGNSIGGGGVAARNVISANLGAGVLLTDVDTRANTVSGNWIGLGATGLEVRGNQGDGVAIQNGARDNVIGGDALLAEGNVISGNGSQGVEIRGSGSDGNEVVGNFIGTDKDGIDSIGSRGFANNNDAIFITDGADATIIGGASASLRNVLSGNDANGISIIGMSDGTLVRGNYIGVDAAGNALGNRLDGLFLFGGATGTEIGGPTADQRNVISGNARNGIAMHGATTTGTVVQGNYIGTNIAGDGAIGNQSNGVMLMDDTSANRIGGDATLGEGNLISGNGSGGFSGITVVDASSGANVIHGNTIGLDRTGTTPISNGNMGVYIENSSGVAVGDAATGFGNVISGNLNHGVYVLQGGATGIVGNRIGTDVTGDLARGNGGDGVHVIDSASVIIGGAAAGAGNTISANAGDGIELTGTSTTGTRIVGNRIGTTGDGTADLGNIGVGIRVHDGASATVIGGDGGAGEGNLVSGNDAGGIIVDGAGGSDTVGNLIHGNRVGTDTLGTSAIGNGGDGIAVFGGARDTEVGGDRDVGLGNLVSGQTAAAGISVSDAATTGTVLLGNRVGTAADGNTALGNRNGIVSTDTIGTRIGGSGTGEANLVSGNLRDGIVVLGAASTGVQIVGNRVGTTANGLGVNGNANHGVLVDGDARQVRIGGTSAAEGNLASGNGGRGIQIRDGHETQILGNLIGTDASGNVGLGNQLRISSTATDTQIGGVAPGAGNTILSVNLIGSGDGTVLEGNRIGIGSDGSTLLGNSSAGIFNRGSGTTTIGGSAPGAGNTISGNTTGIWLHADAGVTRILGNVIGLDSTGTLDRGNAQWGIRINGSNDHVIGEAGAGNTISGNAGAGMLISGSSGLTIAANRIGTSADGTDEIGNGAEGILFNSGSINNLVGGATSADANTIRANADAGIAVTDAASTSNAFLLNVIAANGGLGIDLGTSGVQGNDVQDPDTGANDLQNFPVIARVITDNAGTVQIDGTIDSTPDTDFRLDLFAAGSGDGSGHGQADRHLGTTFVTTDGTGAAVFAESVSAAVAPGEVVSATLTSLDGVGTPLSTSEFSANEAAGYDAAAASDSYTVNADDVLTVAAPGVLGNDPAGNGSSVAGNVVLGFDATTDTDGDATWTSNVGTASLALAPGVTHTASPDNPPTGITAAFDFDGTGGAGGPSLASLPEIDATQSASIELWVRPDSLTGDQILFETTEDGSSGVVLMLNNSLIDLHVSDGSSTVRGSASSNMTAGSWHHVVLSIDVGSGALRSWVDGVQRNSINLISVPAWADGAFGLGSTNGTAVGGQTGDFAGQIAHFRVHDRVLSPAEIAANRDNPESTPTPFVASFDDASTRGDVTVNTDGSFVYDPSGQFDALGDGQTGTDSFEYTSDDGTGNTTVVPVTVSVAGVNDAPVASAIEGANLAYTEGDEAVAISDTLTLSDVDDTDLESATVTVAINYLQGEDMLAFTDQNGISGAWNATTGVLTLSGTSSVANYQSALRSVTYENTADDPDATARLIDIAVNDGEADSNVQSRGLAVTRVNSAPTFDRPSFAAHTITTAADGAHSVAATDVDGDGDLDVLSASYLDDTIAWYENDGSESFTAHAITTAADGARAVESVDIDGDGDLDVLSASLDDGKIAWYENDGSESFTAHTISAAPVGAISVTRADVDGDGDIDVLSASNYSDRITWYENDGSESFTAHTITAAADKARSVTTADVDGDGDIDVLSASQNDDTIAWYENDGSESFTAHTITSAADGAFSVTTSDVDGDGDIDVLSASYNDDTITWYENDGSESFTAHTIATAADGAYSVTTGDVDGDGDTDVISASRFDNTIVWYENDGSERFTARILTTAAYQAVSVAISDVDGDGDLDVLSASLNDDTVAWYENGGGNPIDTLDATPTFGEGGTPVVLDADVTVSDVELTEGGDYGGASLTLSRNGGANAEDVYSATGLLGALIEGGVLIYDGSTIGTVATNSNGVLQLAFGSGATGDEVNGTLRSIAYVNTSDTPPGSVQIDWVFDDGNAGAQGVGGAAQATGSTTVTIVATDDAPVLASNALAITESGTVGLDGTMLSATDVDTADGTLLFTLSSISGGQFELIASPGSPVTSFTQQQITDGDVQFVHDGGETAPTYAVTVSDATSFVGPSAANVSFSNVNDPPRITSDGGGADAALSVSEGNTAVTIVTSADIDGGAPSYAIVGGADSARFAIDAASGALRFLAAPDAENPTDSGRDNVYDVAVGVSDAQGGDAAQSIEVTVTDVDESPVARTDTLIVIEDTVRLIDPANDLLANDADPEAGPLRLVAFGPVTHGTLIERGDGLLEYRPDADFNGVDGFDYRIEDAAGHAVSASVRLEIQAVNDAPTLAPAATDGAVRPGVIDANTVSVGVLLPENATVVGSVQAIDIDSSRIDFSLAGPDAGLFEIDATSGALRVREPLDFEAPRDADRDNRYDLDIVMRDELGAERRVSLPLIVQDLNEAPSLAAGAFTVQAGFSGFVGRLNALDPDVGSEPRFTLLAADPPLGGTLVLMADGRLFATDPPVGVHEIAVRVDDGAGLFADGVVTLRVETTDAPDTGAALPVMPTPEPEPPTMPGPATMPDRPTSIDMGYSEGRDEVGEPAGPTPSMLEGREPGDSIDTAAPPLDGAMPTRPMASAEGLPENGVARGGDAARDSTGDIERILALLLAAQDQESSSLARSGVSGFDAGRFAISLPVELFDALDRLGGEIDRSEERRDQLAMVARGAAVVTGATLTIGSVIWLLRSGVLVATALLTSPLWKPLDPVPILASAADRDDEPDDDEDDGVDFVHGEDKDDA